MQRERITSTGLAVAALLAAPLAWGQIAGGGDGPRGPGRGPGPMRALGLTEQQQAAARQIVEGQRAEREALRAEMRENRAALDEALESEAPDALLVGELVIKGRALKERERALHQEAMKALEPILTEKQKQKLEILESMRGPRGRRGPGGRGVRGGPPE